MENNKSNNNDTSESLDNPRIVKKSKMKNNNELFKELIERQLTDIPSNWRLGINDMKRICKYINSSIFDPTNCCIWNGYITNMHNSNKGTYVNFYFQNKKVALHRLLYSNYVSPLSPNEYLKFNCDNKGICCNVNHYEKYKYTKTNKLQQNIEKKVQQKKEHIDAQIINKNSTDDAKRKLYLDFD